MHGTARPFGEWPTGENFPNLESESENMGSFRPHGGNGKGKRRRGFDFSPKGHDPEMLRQKTENPEDVKRLFEEFLNEFLRKNLNNTEKVPEEKIHDLLGALEEQGVGFIPLKENASQSDCENFFQSVCNKEISPISARSFSDEKHVSSLFLSYLNGGEVSINNPDFIEHYEEHVKTKKK